MILDSLNNISSDSTSSRVALYLVVGALLALSLLNGRGAK